MAIGGRKIELLELAWAIQGLNREYMTASKADADAIKFVGVQVEVSYHMICHQIHNSPFFFQGCTFDAELIFAWFSTKRHTVMTTLEDVWATYSEQKN